MFLPEKVIKKRSRRILNCELIIDQENGLRRSHKSSRCSRLFPYRTKSGRASERSSVMIMETNRTREFCATNGVVSKRSAVIPLRTPWIDSVLGWTPVTPPWMRHVSVATALAKTPVEIESTASSRHSDGSKSE